MRKPNPAITKIQVRHRAFAVFAKFREWVMNNHVYTVYNTLETSAYSDEQFCQINAQGLHMKFREAPHRCEYDQLRLKLTQGRDGQLFYQVGFMEYFEDDEGPAFNSVMVEEFAIYDLYKALECFMERWESEHPWHVSGIRKSSHTDFQRLYKTVGINALHKINIEFTPKEIHAHLTVMGLVNYRSIAGMGAAFNPKQRHVVRPDCGDHATKISAKEVMEIEGGKTVFSDGVVMMEDSDVCPSLEQIRAAKVGYTGNKNNHGSGSMDHISW